MEKNVFLMEKVVLLMGKSCFFFPLFGNCNRVQKYVRHTSLYSIGGSNTVLSFSKKVLIRFCTFMVAS